jgi:hypothetical protein
MAALHFNAVTCELRNPPANAHVLDLDTLRLRMDCLPPEMVAARRWLLWKEGKQPFYPSGRPRQGRLDSQDDLDRLGTLEDALAALGCDPAYLGLGFALGFDPVLGKHWQGLDLDDALAGPDFTTDRARELYGATDGYAERSPSGCGLHVLGLGEPFRAIKWKRPGEQAVELYSAGRFFTVTGQAMREGRLPDLAPLAARVRAELLAGGKVRERKARTAVGRTGDYSARMPDKLREWVQAHPIETALAEHGFEREGDRWLSPRSESGIPGVLVLDEHRAVSFHASDAGIGTEVAGDGECFNAFDLQVRDRFRGDRDAALRTLLGSRDAGPGNAVGEAGGSGDPLPVPEYAELATVGSDPPKPRVFVVAEWIPRGTLVGLWGAGGIGKSLLAQQVGTAVANGVPALEADVTMGPVLGYFTEDDNDELRRRQRAILRAMGRSPEYSTDGLHLQGRAGMDNCLLSFDRERMPKRTAFLELVEAECERIRPALLILDNIAQMYAGIENDRFQVTAFCNVLTGLARRFDLAVLLLGHPGKADGSEYSGSTAWEGAVRTRLWLERCGDDLLELHRRKANYAGRASVFLRYEEGAFMSHGRLEASEALAEAAVPAVLDALATLTARQVATSHNPTATTYLPRLMAREGLLGTVTEQAAKQALRRLLDAGRLVPNVPLGWKKSDRHPAHGLAVVP